MCKQITKIKLRPDLMKEVRKRWKTTTARKGFRRVLPGQPITIVNSEDENDCIDVIVVGSYNCLAIDLDIETFYDTKYQDFREFLLHMKEFYPDFNSDTEITVIEWNFPKDIK